ncbi:MAG: hypothetical protein HW389_877 [Bacteroidetes bacterium]|nr:hypothetical protein [Bacteroidota bacterium]
MCDAGGCFNVLRKEFMDKTLDPSFFVLYSAHHQRCGQSIERTDFRVVTKQDLFAWSRDLAANGAVQPLPIRCDTCAEDVQATHVRIIKDAHSIPRTVVPDMEIKSFHPDDWILKIKEDT